jgi:uncharacterized FlaG/YvyC family protein
MDAQVYKIEGQRPGTAVKVDPVPHDQARAGPEHRDRLTLANQQAGLSHPMDRTAVETAFKEAQQRLGNLDLELKYTISEDSGDIQVELINSENDKVVRKIPADELIKLHSSLKEMAGAFLNRSI